VDQEAGTYEVVVPVGRYRICVTQYTESLADRFDNKFGQGSSPIVRDINAGQVLNIDLNNPDG
jgi:hypothetical protein